MKIKIVLILLFIVSSIKIDAQGLGEWTWMKGSSIPGYWGVFGTKGVSAFANNPPGLYEGFEWTDLNGNFWVFGGVKSFDMYNTLWKYDPIINEWTWINGASSINGSGIYGTMAVPAPANTPGARSYGGVSWIDNVGDLWLFGGNGYDKFGAQGTLNDLWRYNIASNQWTWMAGTDNVTAAAVVVGGTKGVPNIANTPDGRNETNAGVADGVGNLWLFGGLNSVFVAYNDLWKYNIATNMWTWVAGDQTSSHTSPVYGTKGFESLTNDPGDRFSYTKYIKGDSSIFLYGGGSNNYSSNRYFNDVWKFNVLNSQWTWVGGNSLLNEIGVYNSICDTNILNKPTATFESRATWADSCGFYFLNGFGSDLWYYNVENNEFTWINGVHSNTGSFGTIGISSLTNSPPAMIGALAFKDKVNNLWLFGGDHGSSGIPYSDMWRFKLDPNCKANCKKNNETLETNINIPNVFTPNGDGTNGLFTVKATNYKKYHIIIYDRWGLKLFETTDFNSHWNGKPNNIGNDCPEGTYFYIINLVDKSDNSTDYKGFLTLFR